MGRRFWSFRNAADEPGVGELWIYGLIESDSGLAWLFDAVTPRQFKAELDGLGDISELRVFINSDGGDVFAGQAIHSMLKRHPAHVTVMVDGLAASIAAVVAMAGDTVKMPRNAMMMVHNPFGLTIGDAEEHRKFAGMLDRVREAIVAAYLGKTGLTRDELLPMLEAETWMTAAEAVEMGFADEIEEAKQIEASLVAPGVLLVNGQAVNLNRFSNPPQALMDGGSLPEGKDQSVGAASTGPSAGPSTGSGHSSGNSYATQGVSMLAALSEYEERTLARLASREKAGRALSEADLERWGLVRDTATRVLERADASTEGGDDAALAVAIEYEKIKSRLNGVEIGEATT